MKKKALAFALVLCMVIAMLPVSVFAAPVSEAAAPLTATTVGELTPTAVEPNAKSYSVKISKTGKGTAELLVDSPAQAGSEVYFTADPDDGYLAYIYCDGVDPDDVVYLGADVYGFIMPGNKVTLQVEFVAAEGSEHRISVYEEGSGNYELSRTSAKEYESVLLAVKPRNNSNFDPLNYIWCQGADLYYLFEENGIHYYEIFMGDDYVYLFVTYEMVGPFRVDPFRTAGEDSCTVTIEPKKANFLDTVTVTIVPSPGYEITRIMAVSYAGSLTTELTPIGNNQYTFIMHPANVDIYIDAEQTGFPVSVTCTSGGSALVNPTIAMPGSTVTVTCFPDKGYCVESVTGVDGLTAKGSNAYTFTMPKHEVDLNVSFTLAVNTITATVETGLGGTVALSQTEATMGETITLTAIPEEGYRVAQITGVKYTDNGDGTYTFTMPDKAVNIKVLFLRHENPFLDVNETQFFYTPVLWAVENGITSGMTPDTFGPFAFCNRAQVVTFLWRAAGSPEPETAENPFTDVPANSWFTKPVLWALENGITTGVSPTEFGPNAPCNRAQVVTFLWRLMGQREPGLTENPFTDVQSGSWYEKSVLWALENGITTGSSATTFNPTGECQRAQVVTFLYRTAQLPALYEVVAVYDAAMGEVTLSHTEAAEGETVTVTVLPGEGYTLDSITADVELTQVSDTEYTFVMPAGPVSIQVSFAEVQKPSTPGKTYELVLKANGHGKVAYTEKSTGIPGESIFFYAIPEEGYYLERVGIFNPDNAIDMNMIQIIAHEDDLYEIIMINHDIIMTCYFSPIPG